MHFRFLLACLTAISFFFSSCLGVSSYFLAFFFARHPDLSVKYLALLMEERPATKLNTEVVHRWIAGWLAESVDPEFFPIVEAATEEETLQISAEDAPRLQLVSADVPLHTSTSLLFFSLLSPSLGCLPLTCMLDERRRDFSSLQNPS